MNSNGPRNSYRPNSLRKRRRNYSPSAPNSSEDFLLIEDAKQSKPIIQNSVPEDDKIVNSLNKIGYKVQIDDAHRRVSIRMIVGLTEAAYFENQEDEFVKYLKDHFHINDFSISKHMNGAIERYLSVFGDVVSVSKAAIYIGFILNAKLNNIIKNELYTLKSPNYQLRLLVSIDDEQKIREMSEVSRLRQYDTSIPFNYNYNPNLYTLQIKGDFHALFGFLMAIINLNSKYNYIDDSKIEPLKIIGAHSDPNLFQRSEGNNEKLGKQISSTLEFVYSKSFLHSNESK